MSFPAPEDWIVPDWPAPATVHSLFTTRHGGVSSGPYASLNLGSHVGDDPEAVAANRARLARVLPQAPVWLEQVHGTVVVDLDRLPPDSLAPPADAVVARSPGRVAAIMTADCLPVLFCNRAGTAVAAAHAGWRGLQAGVLEAAVTALDCPPEEVLAWLGPAIGPLAFEVGDEVRAALVDDAPQAALAFQAQGEGKWLADIYLLARQRLAARGVHAVYGGQWCTVSEPVRFFSYRRDGVTGRMAALIWLAPGG